MTADPVDYAELLDLLSTFGAALLQRATAAAQTTVLPGTIVELDGDTAMVLIDGSTAPIPVANAGLAEVGSRVQVLFFPPQGALAIGSGASAGGGAVMDLTRWLGRAVYDGLSHYFVDPDGEGSSLWEVLFEGGKVEHTLVGTSTSDGLASASIGAGDQAAVILYAEMAVAVLLASGGFAEVHPFARYDTPSGLEAQLNAQALSDPDLDTTSAAAYLVGRLFTKKAPSGPPDGTQAISTVGAVAKAIGVGALENSATFHADDLTAYVDLPVPVGDPAAPVASGAFLFSDLDTVTFLKALFDTGVAQIVTKARDQIIDMDVDEVNDLLKFTVTYADGTTIKTGEVPLF